MSLSIVPHSLAISNGGPTKYLEKGGPEPILKVWYCTKLTVPRYCCRYYVGTGVGT